MELCERCLAAAESEAANRTCVSAMSGAANVVGHAAMRAILRRTLEANGWSLTLASKALRAGGPGSLVRWISDLGMREEYERHKRAGAGRPGPKPRAA